MFQVFQWLGYYTGVIIPQTILLIGVETSGKSTFLSKVQTGMFKKDRQATIRKEQTVMILNGNMVKIIDMPGHKEFREDWKEEYGNVHSIIFFIDGSNSDKFTDAKAEYDKIMGDESLMDIPMAIVDNKSDLMGYHNSEYIREMFDIHECDESSRPQKVFEASMMDDGKSIYHIINWISQFK